jgi:hypothetical protein
MAVDQALSTTFAIDCYVARKDTETVRWPGRGMRVKQFWKIMSCLSMETYSTVLINLVKT